MKLLVDEMPYYKDDCIFAELGYWSDERNIWINICKLTDERCDLDEGQCSCLRIQGE